MLFAQVGMGGIDLRPLLPLWTGGCGLVLAIAAVFCRLVWPTRQALQLGLGIGTCFMSALTVLVWFLLELSLPAAAWMVAVPPLSLLIGVWATVRGSKVLR